MADSEQNLGDEQLDPPAIDANNDTWVTDEDAVEDLNIRWRKVIDELMNGAKIYEAYARAYDIEIEKPSQYNVAKANGSRLLTNANFRRLWDKVLAEQGFNNQAVDSELRKLIFGGGIEPKDKLKAIGIFYDLQGRITKKVDHTTKGDKLASPYRELTADELRKLAEGAGPDGDSAISQD